MPFADKYKTKGSRYEDERSLRAVVKERERRAARYDVFSRGRNIDEDILKPLAGETKSGKGKKELQLLQWKQKKEREKQEALKKNKKRPPFVVGVVHHKYNPEFPSPVHSSGSVKKGLKVEKSLPFKSREFKPPSSVVPIVMVPFRSKENTIPVSNRRKEPIRTGLSKGHLRASIKTGKSEVQPRRSARLTLKAKEAPKENNWQKNKATSSIVPEIKVDLPSIAESGDEVGKSEEKDEDFILSNSIFAATFSPFICKTRGKGRSPAKKPVTPLQIHNSGGLRKQIARKIIEEKLIDHSKIEEEENCGTLVNKSNLLVPSEDPVITNFRELHSAEIKRLEGLCLDWDVLLASLELTADVKDSIRSTVCQARLLMREKLAQFKDLVDRCADCGPSTECKVTHSDLQGFWDLVSIQIEDINNKFKKLDDLKDNNWVEMVKELSAKKQRIRKVNKEPVKTKSTNLDKKSAFQLFLLEKKKKDAGNQPIVTILTPSNKISKGCLKEGRRSTRNSSVGNQEGDSCVVRRTPRRVLFTGLYEEADRERTNLPTTPHLKKVSLESSGLCTPVSMKRRSQRLLSDSINSSGGIPKC